MCLILAACSPGNRVAESRHYPTLFVGEPLGGGQLGLYSANTGQRERSLPLNVSSTEPDLVDGGQWIYFLSAVGPCNDAIFKVRASGGSAIAVRTHLEGTLVFGVSLDGKMLAYQTVSGSVAQCEQHGGGGELLTVVNLTTGASRTMRLPSIGGVNSLAWAPNDRSITLATGAANGEGPATIHIVNALTGNAWATEHLGVCPDHKVCYVLAVAYARNGSLYYLRSEVAPTTGRYQLMELSSRAKTRTLHQWSGRASSGGWETVDPSGNAVILLIPARNGAMESIRWSQRATRALSSQLFSASWS